jgi:hypothetical protein
VATISDSGFSTVTETGATVSYTEAGSTAPIASVTVSGGSATIHSDTSNGLQVTTNAGTSTSITMGAGKQSLTSNANDQIHAGSGADSILAVANGATIWAGSGSLSVLDRDWTNSDMITIHGGTGALSFDGAGGAMTFIGGTGSAVINGEYGTLHVTGGTGNLTVSGGCGPTSFIAGSGVATVNLTAAGGSVAFGAGATTVNECTGGNAVSYSFLAGYAAGTDIINNFKVGTDKLVLTGVSIASEAVTGGLANIVLTNSSHITLTGVTSLVHLMS